MGFIEGIMTTGLEVLKGLNGLGLAGRVGYVCGLGVWTLLCLPTTPVELAAGVSFPLLSCCAMSAAGKTVGSLVALLLGRRLLRPFIARYLADRGGGGALHSSVVIASRPQLGSLARLSCSGLRDPSRAHLGCAPTGPRAGALRCWISMRACGASVSARQRLRFRTLHNHRHNHLLRELREHPIQTMSLLRAAPLPTPLKIYGLSLFPAELIPLTSYAGIAITFNLLRAQHVQDVATEPGHPAARGHAPFGLASFGLAHGTACRHGGPQALRASGPQSKAAPRSARAVPPGGPCEPPPRRPEREPRQSSSSNRVGAGLCVQVVSRVDARELVCQQPGGREELLDGRDRRQDLAAARAARPRHPALTLRARAAAGARPHTRTVHRRYL